jgi:hypothetical protein
MTPHEMGKEWAGTLGYIVILLVLGFGVCCVFALLVAGAVYAVGMCFSADCPWPIRIVGATICLLIAAYPAGWIFGKAQQCLEKGKHS